MYVATAACIDKIMEIHTIEVVVVVTVVMPVESFEAKENTTDITAYYWDFYIYALMCI